MFSGMRKPIVSFVFRKKNCKVYIYANISCFDYAWLVPLWWYLDGLWIFCKTWNLKWPPWNHRSYILSNKSYCFLSGTTIILPAFDIIIMYTMLREALLYIFPSKLHTGTSLHYTCVVSLHITPQYNQLHDRLETQTQTQTQIHLFYQIKIKTFTYFD